MLRGSLLGSSWTMRFTLMVRPLDAEVALVVDGVVEGDEGLVAKHLDLNGLIVLAANQHCWRMLVELDLVFRTVLRVLRDVEVAARTALKLFQRVVSREAIVLRR